MRANPVRGFCMAVNHYENFPVASFLMPRALVPAVTAIYRFARTADDIADEGTAGAGERLRLLAALQDDLARLQTQAGPAHPTVAALQAHVRQHHLPVQAFEHLLSAFAQDVTTTRYATYQDVLDYCRRSANPVGRLMLCLYRAHGLRQQQQSDAVCTGLQLVNFWQDVQIDLQKDRIYLPQEDLLRFGVPEQELVAQPAAVMQTTAWQGLMQFEVNRAADLLRQGLPLKRALGGRIGLELAAIIHGGLRICEKLAACGYDVARARPVLTKRDWVVIGWRALKT
jgi:squalene synthase HpnC